MQCFDQLDIQLKLGQSVGGLDQQRPFARTKLDATVTQIRKVGQQPQDGFA